MLFSPDSFLNKFKQELYAANDATLLEIINFSAKFCRFCRDCSESKNILAEKQQTLLADCILIYMQHILSYSDSVSQLNERAIRDFCAVISDCAKVNGVGDVYVQEICSFMFENITAPTIKPHLSKELLLNFNEVLVSATRLLRNKIAADYKMFLCKFIDLLCLCGDYTMQISLLETVFRLCSPQQIDEYAQDLFPATKILQDEICKIRKHYFDHDSRKFLNTVNSKFKNVFSIKCKCIILDDLQIHAPEDIQESELWVDFNSGSNTVSFYYDEDSLGSKHSPNTCKGVYPWGLICFNDAEVIAVIESLLLVEDAPTSQGSIILFELVETAIPEHKPLKGNGTVKQLKLVILNGPDLQWLVKGILPKMFGEKYKRMIPALQESQDTTVHFSGRAPIKTSFINASSQRFVPSCEAKVSTKCSLISGEPLNGVHDYNTVAFNDPKITVLHSGSTVQKKPTLQTKSQSALKHYNIIKTSHGYHGLKLSSHVNPPRNSVNREIQMSLSYDIPDTDDKNSSSSNCSTHLSDYSDLFYENMKTSRQMLNQGQEPVAYITIEDDESDHDIEVTDIYYDAENLHPPSNNASIKDEEIIEIIDTEHPVVATKKVKASIGIVHSKLITKDAGCVHNVSVSRKNCTFTETPFLSEHNSCEPFLNETTANIMPRNDSNEETNSEYFTPQILTCNTQKLIHDERSPSEEFFSVREINESTDKYQLLVKPIEREALRNTESFRQNTTYDQSENVLIVQPANENYSDLMLEVSDFSGLENQRIAEVTSEVGQQSTNLSNKITLRANLAIQKKTSPQSETTTILHSEQCEYESTLIQNSCDNNQAASEKASTKITHSPMATLKVGNCSKQIQADIDSQCEIVKTDLESKVQKHNLNKDGITVSASSYNYCLKPCKVLLTNIQEPLKKYCNNSIATENLVKEMQTKTKNGYNRRVEKKNEMECLNSLKKISTPLTSRSDKFEDVINASEISTAIEHDLDYPDKKIMKSDTENKASTILKNKVPNFRKGAGSENGPVNATTTISSYCNSFALKSTKEKQPDESNVEDKTANEKVESKAKRRLGLQFQEKNKRIKCVKLLTPATGPLASVGESSCSDILEVQSPGSSQNTCKFLQDKEQMGNSSNESTGISVTNNYNYCIKPCSVYLENIQGLVEKYRNPDIVNIQAEEKIKGNGESLCNTSSNEKNKRKSVVHLLQLENMYYLSAKHYQDGTKCGKIKSTTEVTYKAKNRANKFAELPTDIAESPLITVESSIFEKFNSQLLNSDKHIDNILKRKPDNQHDILKTAVTSKEQRQDNTDKHSSAALIANFNDYCKPCKVLLENIQGLVQKYCNPQEAEARKPDEKPHQKTKNKGEEPHSEQHCEQGQRKKNQDPLQGIPLSMAKVIATDSSENMSGFPAESLGVVAVDGKTVGGERRYNMAHAEDNKRQKNKNQDHLQDTSPSTAQLIAIDNFENMSSFAAESLDVAAVDGKTVGGKKRHNTTHAEENRRYGNKNQHNLQDTSLSVAEIIAVDNYENISSFPAKSLDVAAVDGKTVGGIRRHNMARAEENKKQVEPLLEVAKPLLSVMKVNGSAAQAADLINSVEQQIKSVNFVSEHIAIAGKKEMDLLAEAEEATPQNKINDLLATPATGRAEMTDKKKSSNQGNGMKLLGPVLQIKISRLPVAGIGSIETLAEKHIKVNKNINYVNLINEDKIECDKFLTTPQQRTGRNTSNLEVNEAQNFTDTGADDTDMGDGRASKPKEALQHLVNENIMDSPGKGKDNQDEVARTPCSDLKATSGLLLQGLDSLAVTNKECHNATKQHPNLEEGKQKNVEKCADDTGLLISSAASTAVQPVSSQNSTKVISSFNAATDVILSHSKPPKLNKKQPPSATNDSQKVKQADAQEKYDKLAGVCTFSSTKPAEKQKRLNTRKLHNPCDTSYLENFSESDFINAAASSSFSNQNIPRKKMVGRRRSASQRVSSPEGICTETIKTTAIIEPPPRDKSDHCIKAVTMRRMALKSKGRKDPPPIHFDVIEVAGSEDVRWKGDATFRQTSLPRTLTELSNREQASHTKNNISADEPDKTVSVLPHTIAIQNQSECKSNASMKKVRRKNAKSKTKNVPWKSRPTAFMDESKLSHQTIVSNFDFDSLIESMHKYNDSFNLKKRGMSRKSITPIRKSARYNTRYRDVVAREVPQNDYESLDSDNEVSKLSARNANSPLKSMRTNKDKSKQEHITRKLTEQPQETLQPSYDSSPLPDLYIEKQTVKRKIIELSDTDSVSVHNKSMKSAHTSKTPPFGADAEQQLHFTPILEQPEVSVDDDKTTVLMPLVISKPCLEDMGALSKQISKEFNSCDEYRVSPIAELVEPKNQQIMKWIATGLPIDASKAYKKNARVTLRAVAQIVKATLQPLRGPIPPDMIDLYDTLIKIDHEMSNYFSKISFKQH